MNVTDRRSAHKNLLGLLKKAPLVTNTFTHTNSHTHIKSSTQPRRVEPKPKLKCMKKSADDFQQSTEKNTAPKTKNKFNNVQIYIDCNYSHQKSMMLNLVYSCCWFFFRMDLAFRSDRQIFQFWFAAGDSLNQFFRCCCFFVESHN